MKNGVRLKGGYAKRLKIMLFFLFVFLGLNFSFGQNTNAIDIRADFPGGNVLIEKMVGDTLWLAPDTRNISGSWFYWYFSVESKSDRNLWVVFPKNMIPSYGPAVSVDGGESWDWLFDDLNKGLTAFHCKLKANQEARFSIGFPYLRSDYDKFITTYRTHPFVQQDTLCTLTSGRDVPVIYVGNKKAGRAKGKIVLTARHHACEMMASYSLEGAIKAILDHGEYDWLTDNYEIMIIPFVDLDGVESGDQGKNRTPRDHNRDYSGESIYETTRAIRKILPDWVGDDPLFVLDLHCPGLVGAGHELVYMVGSKDHRFAQEEESFAKILDSESRNGLHFRKDDLLKFGYSWNVDGGERLGDSFRSWVQKNFVSAKLVTILEIPYANNRGQRVTPENLRSFGEDAMMALEKYLSSL